MTLARRRWCIAFAALALAAGGVRADDQRGYLKLSDQWSRTPSDSVDAALGEQYSNDAHLDLRGMGDLARGPWSAEAHAQLLVDYGTAVALQQQLRQLPGVGYQDPEDSSWLHLRQTLHEDDRNRDELRLDRLYAGYTSEHFVMRAGRQAITWGTGQIFHPMDLFDPFAPNAVDTEYKTGADMLYGQWLFDDGNDLQGLVVPRRNVDGGGLRADQSSAAIRYHRTGELENAWMLARDYQSTVVGVSLGGPLGQASWSSTLVPTVLDSGSIPVSGVINLSGALTLHEHPASLLLEYYHNGFGHGGSGYALSELSPELQQRLARGQVFVTGRDYLGAAFSLDATPLLKLAPTAIANLHDGSTLALLQLTYSLSENFELVGFGQLPIGGRGTEFGGLSTVANGRTFATPPTFVYLRLAYYF